MFNPATAFINIMERIGWAYDLKKASKDVIKNRQSKVGDIEFVQRSKFWEFATGLLVFTSPLWGYYFAKMSPWLIPVIFAVGYFIQ